jgi:hypothetical protein
MSRLVPAFGNERHALDQGASSNDEALSKLYTAITRAQHARDAEVASKISDAFYWWGKLFDGAFPAYG